MNQRVDGLIPGQGICLGCGLGPQWRVCDRQPYIDVFLSFSFPSPLSKNKINEIFLKIKIKYNII